jgi:hypothetical protein
VTAEPSVPTATRSEKLVEKDFRSQRESARTFCVIALLVVLAIGCFAFGPGFL